MDPTVRECRTLKIVGGESDAGRGALRKHCRKLRSHHECFIDGREKALLPGMLAVWKPHMKNRQTPEYGEPMVVVAVLNDGLMDTEHGCGSVYYREPLGLVLGFVDEDGDFLIRHYDARRFEQFTYEPDAPA